MKLNSLSTNRIFIVGAVLFIYITFAFQSISNTKGQFAYIDFASFYAGAKATFIQNTSPYSQKVINEYKDEMGVDQIYPYLYPPPSLFVFYPLSKLSFENSKWLAFIVNHLLLVGIYLTLLPLITKNFGTATYLPIIIFTVYFFSYDPIINTFTIGQSNLILLFCLSSIWWLISRDSKSKISDIGIGLLLSITILLKLYPAILLLFFLFKRDFKVVIFATVFTLLFSFISLMILPAGIWQDWINVMLAKAAIGENAIDFVSPGFPWNISVSAFFSRLFSVNNWTRPLINAPMIGTTLTYLVSIALVTAVLWKSYKLKSSYKTESINAEFGLYLLTMFLIAPVSWGHHLAFILPAIIITVGYLIKENPVPKTVLMITGSVIVIGLKIPYWSSVLYSPALNWAISIKMFAIVLLWFYLLTKTKLNDTNIAY